MKILVIQQKMIGDVLASSIICNNLKIIYPESRIDYLIYPFTKAVVENNANIDQLVLFKEEYRTSKIAFMKFLFSIKKENYDLVIDAYGIWESNLIVWMSGAKRRIGLKKAYTNFIYTDTIVEREIPLTNAGLALENRMLLLEPLHSDKLLDNRPKIYMTAEEIASGKQILLSNNITSGRKIYMLSILGSGANKTYPLPFMAKILDFIASQKDAALLFNYMPPQIAEAQNLFDLCLPETQKRIYFNIVPGTIRAFLSVTYHCDALIGNEGGAVNMAKALGIPTFTIFSPWIKKEAWNSFEDGTTNVSVHLRDFLPEVYGNKPAKEMKNEAIKLYRLFEPKYILPKLQTYLEIN